MKNNKIAITQPITIHKLNTQYITSNAGRGTDRGTRISKRAHSRSNKTRRLTHSLSPKLHTTKTMRGGAVRDREPFRSQGIFELTGDAMLYVLSNVVKLASNMIAASVGYAPINNTLGQPGYSQSDSGVFKDISALVGYAKIPINTMLKTVDTIAAQYINILNGQMRVTTPMMQEALTITVNILKTQLTIATNTLNNPSFIAVLRTAIEAIESASDEIVGVIDPVAANILAKLSPIITRTIATIMSTIGVSTLSGMQAIPYLGTVLAALSSLDAVSRLYISAINAGSATGTVLFDGYTDTIYRLTDTIKGIKSRISGTMKGMNAPATIVTRPPATATATAPAPEPPKK